MAERTGQGGGRTIRGYVRHPNGYYYKPGKPNIFYKQVGNTFKPVSQGTIRMKPPAGAGYADDIKALKNLLKAGGNKAKAAVQQLARLGVRFGPTGLKIAPGAITGGMIFESRGRENAAAMSKLGVGTGARGGMFSGGESNPGTGNAPVYRRQQGGLANLPSDYADQERNEARKAELSRGRIPGSLPPSAGDTQRNIVSGGADPAPAPRVRDSLKVRIEKEYDVLRDEFNNNEIGAVEFKAEAEKLF